MSGRILNHPAFHISMILILGFAVYSNTFNVPFVFDDEGYILENPIIKKPGFFVNPLAEKGLLLPENVRIHLYSRYLGYLSFYINYVMNGKTPFGYHVFNIAVHLINGVLVYLLARIILGAPMLRDSDVFKSRGWIALFSALAFTLHPIQTQAVTYISQRFACLAAMFALGSAAAYAAFVSADGRAKKAVFYSLAVISALAAFFTKENALMLPLAILLYDVSFVKDRPPRAAVRVFPFFVLAAASALAVTMRLQDMLKHEGGLILLDKTYALTSVRVMVTYLRLFFLPIGQSVEYDYPSFSSFFSIEIMASVLFLVLIAEGAVYCLYVSRKKDPAYSIIFFGVFWFFGFMTIENGLVKLDDVIFDHRLYLPSAGLIIAVSVLIFKGLAKSRGKTVIYAVTAFLSVSVIALGAAAYYRNSLWKTPVFLWEDGVRKNPRSARLHSNLAKTYFDAGREEESFLEFRKAVMLDPAVGIGHQNLAIMYERRGDFQKAEEHYKTAIVLMPNLAVSYFNLAKIYMDTGRTDKAEEYFLNSIKYAPSNASAYVSLGRIYYTRGEISRAREYFAEGLRFAPQNRVAKEYIEHMDSLLKQGGK